MIILVVLLAIWLACGLVVLIAMVTGWATRSAIEDPEPLSFLDIRDGIRRP